MLCQKLYFVVNKIKNWWKMSEWTEINWESNIFYEFLKNAHEQTMNIREIPAAMKE